MAAPMEAATDSASTSASALDGQWMDISLGRLGAAVVVSAALTVPVALVYRRIQRRQDYSQELGHTFVLVGIVTSLVMLLIGSNLARAFSLVGALSIIRFRTAIRSALDLGFLFVCVGIGLACGVGFLLHAAVGTALVLGVVLVQFRFGSRPPHPEYLLRVSFHVNVNHRTALDPLLDEFFDSHSLSYEEDVRQGTQREVVYLVRPRPGLSSRRLLDAVARVNDGLDASYRSVRAAAPAP